MIHTAVQIAEYEEAVISHATEPGDAVVHVRVQIRDRGCGNGGVTLFLPAVAALALIEALRAGLDAIEQPRNLEERDINF